MARMIDADFATREARENPGIYDLNDVPEWLSYLPTVDAEPVRHGRWITWAEAGNDVPSEELYECSACHDAAPHLVSGFDFLSAYCPNCGAKMDLEVQSYG